MIVAVEPPLWRPLLLPLHPVKPGQRMMMLGHLTSCRTSSGRTTSGKVRIIRRRTVFCTLIPSETVHFYRPKRSFGQGNIFTPLCHSVHRGGGLARRPPRLDGGTPPGWRTPPDGEPPPGSGLRHTVYDRPVRILLECILVFYFKNKNDCNMC